ALGLHLHESYELGNICLPFGWPSQRPVENFFDLLFRHGTSLARWPRTKTDSCRSPLPHQLQPVVLAQHGDAELLRARELRAGARAGDHVVGLLRDRARSLGAEPLGHGFRLLAGHLFERAGEHHGLAGYRGMPRRALGVEDSHFAGQALDDAPVVLLAEIGLQALDDGVADLIDRIELLTHVRIAGDELLARP